jgi:hypothetical protein
MTKQRYPQPSTAIRVDEPRPALPPRPPSEPPTSAWTRFWFSPTPATGLHVLRVLTGLLCLLWLLPLAGHIDSFYGLAGWFDAQAFRDAAKLPELDRGLPNGDWGIQYLAGTNPTALTVIYWTAIGVLVLFTLGIATRITSVLTWVIVVSFLSNPAMEYDADAFLAMFAFYLMVGYLFMGLMHGGLSLHERILGGCNTLFLGRSRRADGQQNVSVASNLALRLLQVHFAIAIVTTGLHKLQFGDWWAGFALWYPTYPPGSTTVAAAREHAADLQTFLFTISFAAYAMLAWQIGFPLFAWRRRWAAETPGDDATPLQKVAGWLIGPRTILFGGAFVGCLGLMFLYQLPLLGPALVIGCLSYVSPEDWQWLANLRRRTVRDAEASAPAIHHPPAASRQPSPAGRN